MKITLKAARINCNLSQKEAARLRGVNQVTLSKWETGKSVPMADRIPAITKVYGITYNDLRIEKRKE